MGEFENSLVTYKLQKANYSIAKQLKFLIKKYPKLFSRLKTTFLDICTPTRFNSIDFSTYSQVTIEEQVIDLCQIIAIWWIR